MTPDERRLEHTADALTLREVLRLRVVREGKPSVVAAHDQLDRPIRWAHAGEVPTIAKLLKGGELLLTTGMGIGERSQEQIDYVSQLAGRQVAGLMVELGTRFTELPAPLIRAADGSGVPLIALEREVAFVEITEAVHREILNRQFLLMQRGASLDRRFFSLALDGAGVPDVLSVLAGAIANPVALRDPDGDVLFSAPVGQDDAQGTTDSTAPMLSQLVPVGSGAHARLVAVGRDSPIDEFARVALERAAGVIALILLRDQQGEIDTDVGSILELLLDRALREPEALALAAGLGLADRAGLKLAVAATLQRSVVQDAAEISWAPLVRVLRRDWGPMSTTLASIRDRGRVLLLAVPLDTVAARQETARAVAEALHTAADRHAGDGPSPVVCVGRVARDWTGLGAALREALDELATAGHGQVALWHDATRPRLDGLLWSLRDDPELRAFVDIQLGPLLAPGHSQTNELLLRTLATLCAHDGRKAEAARSLGVQRQSLYRRLNRIESLLGLDLADDDAMFRVHLAVRAQRYFDGPL